MFYVFCVWCRLSLDFLLFFIFLPPYCHPFPPLFLSFPPSFPCLLSSYSLFLPSPVLPLPPSVCRLIAFVHWAYGKDQQAMQELETKTSSTFEDQCSFKAGHLPAVESMRHRLEYRCLVNVCIYYIHGTYTFVPVTDEYCSMPVTVLPLS